MRAIYIAALFLAGCASYSGVVPAGGDTFIITRQQATGGPGLGNMKTDLMIEAKDYCKKTNQAFIVVDVQETKPPYVLGNYPRVELTFACYGER